MAKEFKRTPYMIALENAKKEAEKQKKEDEKKKIIADALKDLERASDSPINLVKGLRQVSETMAGSERISLEKIDPLTSFEHPFEKSLEMGIDELVSSIKANGVWQPIIVREKPDGRFELLSGHRRTKAAKLAGLDKIPANVIDCDDDVARLIVTETNTCQRDIIYPSEKAKAYKMQLEAIKRIAGRPKKEVEEKDNLFSLVPQKKVNSYQEIAEANGESRAQIQRYVQLNELIGDLLNRVDDDELSLKAGVEISYLPVYAQEEVESIFEEKDGFRIKVEQAEALKKKFKDEEMTLDEIREFLLPSPVSKVKPKYKVAISSAEKHIKKYLKKNTDKLNLIDADELSKRLEAAIDEYLNEL